MIPATMKAPGDFRSGVWRGRVLQVKITNICDLDCKNCSVAVGPAKKLKKQFLMTPDQFRTACQSLKGYDGVVGMFGGNPCISKYFEQLCEIMREEIPDMAQRGLWSNRLFGHGVACRQTFNPHVSNLNVHQDSDAYDEMIETWPGCNPVYAGLHSPSHHGPIFGSMTELGLSEEEMWKKIGKCYVNQTWSAAITVVDKQLVGYFCEIAATMAELTGDPSKGVKIEPGWWAKKMPYFEHQVHEYCTKCLIPLNPRKIDAASAEPEEHTAAWTPVFATIKGRPMKEINSLDAIMGDDAPATHYLPRK